MKKGVIIGIFLIVIVGGFGIYGGMLYNAATQLETGDIEVTDLKMSLSSVTVDLNIGIVSPNGFAVKIDGGNFSLYINGSYIGPGVIGPFTATKEPSSLPVSITIPSSNINAKVLSTISSYLLLNRDLLITINITSIKLFGINIALDLEENIVI